MNNTIGVGYIGLGTIARIHLTAIQKCEQLKLIGFYSEFYEDSLKEAEKWNCKAYQTSEEMFTDPNIGLVVLLTPPGVHKKFVFDAIKHKKHILLEKPIGTNIEDIESYVNAAKEANVSLSVMSQHRFDEATLFVKEKIEKGYLGELVGANCIVNWYRKESYYQGWRSTRETAGGGVLAITGVHTIDLMLYLIGNVKSVSGYVTNRLHKHVSVEDTAMAVVEFSNGSLGNISASTSSYPGFPARLDILGTKGSATIEADLLVSYKSQLDDDQSMIYTGELKTTDSPDDVNVEPFVAQYKNIIESIEKGSSPIVTGDEAYKTYQLVDAIYRSSETGSKITF